MHVPPGSHAWHDWQSMPRPLCPGLVGIGLFLLALWGLAFSSPGLARMDAPGQGEWFRTMHAGKSLELPAKVMRTRVLFAHIAWNPDTDPNGYWATPEELLAKGSGDLLDLVTAYYFTLRGMGVAAEDIRIFIGKLRTLDSLVPHILLAIRSTNGVHYYVDPLRDAAMTDETPNEFRPSLAFNEEGLWHAAALSDFTVWTTRGGSPENVPRWVKVCQSTLAMLGLRGPVTSFDAIVENTPPASGGTQPRKPAAGKSKSGSRRR